VRPTGPIDPAAVTVVIPTYNERLTLPAVTGAVTAHGYRVLVVDDASPDGTGRVADAIAAGNTLVSVLHRPGKQGLGPAYAAGMARALDGGPEVVCQMDADLSHDPAALPGLVAAIAAGNDMALGSRLVPGGTTVDWPLRRRVLSRMGNRYARIALGIPHRDVTTGFRAFRSAALRALDPGSCLANGYIFQVEMAWRAHRAGMQVAEVPIVFTDRAAGSSKMGLGIVAEAMWLVTRWGTARIFGRLPADGGPVVDADEGARP
jgi:dolichol-phosphate mannosyltransferase